MSVGIGYILLIVREYMLVEFTYWYKIYSANNWGIYVNWRVKTVRLQNMLFFFKKIYITHSSKCTICSPAPEGRTNTPIIDIYLSIVGRIYPIPEYICPLLAKYIQYQNISANCWQNISNTRIYSTIHIFPNCWQYISNTNI